MWKLTGFINRLKSLPAFEIFKWKDLTSEEREYILNRKKQGWYDTVFCPFANEDTIEFNSLGLRHEGKVVGWMITHRISPDTIQYWCLFIDPAFQTTGIGMHLLVQAILLQHHSNPPSYALFGFREERINKNPQWISFFKKRIFPYCSNVIYTYEAIKKLH